MGVAVNDKVMKFGIIIFMLGGMATIAGMMFVIFGDFPINSILFGFSIPIAVAGFVISGLSLAYDLLRSMFK